MCAWNCGSGGGAAESSPGPTHGEEHLRFSNPPEVREPESDRDFRRRMCIEQYMQRIRGDAGMPYTPATKRALRLSFEAHRNQRDKGGLPYVYHPFHLADQMTDEVEACAALLHDAVEDGHLTERDLRAAGIPEEAIEAVRALTHDPQVPYMHYVLSLREHPVARAVKIADLRHNANLARLENPTSQDERRRMKYLIALALLDDTNDEFDAYLNHWRKRIPLDSDPRHTYYLSVFYHRDGSWEKLCIDEELADDSHYEFDVCHAEKLRVALGGQDTLAEALAEALWNGGLSNILHIMREQAIPWKGFHFG